MEGEHLDQTWEYCSRTQDRAGIGAKQTQAMTLSENLAISVFMCCPLCSKITVRFFQKLISDLGISHDF